MSEIDEDLALPADTLRILNEFLQEKAKREVSEKEQAVGKNVKFEEDWQLSQFWYSERTKVTLAAAVGRLQAANLANETSSAMNVALLSCPSLYAAVKEQYPNVKIFEYDKRFAAFGDDFVFYDFNEAESAAYLKELWNSFDIIIADPPFLSEECIQKMSRFIHNLQRSSAKIIFCSGDIVEPWLLQHLALRKCSYRPEHERNLGNEFASYANFDLDSFINM